jgi:NAD(P)-dependent dehydrogenase (short-subunit alcohol dehydrogenase family)
MTAPHAVVVGGTRGLGRVVVDRFLARECRVSVVSRQRPADFPEGANLRHFAADLESNKNFGDLCNQIAKASGPIRYLVLSQRFRGQGDPWAGEIQVGLTASRDLIEGFATRFVETGDRAIGVVSSVYAEFVGSSQPVGYHVVKGGLNAMVRHYAATLGRRGIRVNAIMPLTYLKQESRAFYEKNEKLMDTYRCLVPLGRLGTAEESADALDFLCSERASFINGQCLFLDGGVSVVWPEEVAKTFAGL